MRRQKSALPRSLEFSVDGELDGVEEARGEGVELRAVLPSPPDLTITHPQAHRGAVLAPRQQSAVACGLWSQLRWGQIWATLPACSVALGK